MSDRRKWGSENDKLGDPERKSNYLPASGCYDSSWQAGRAAAYCKAFIIAVHQPFSPSFAFSSHNFSMYTAVELHRPLSYLWLRHKQQCVFVRVWACSLEHVCVVQLLPVCMCVLFFQKAAILKSPSALKLRQSRCLSAPQELSFFSFKPARGDTGEGVQWVDGGVLEQMSLHWLLRQNKPRLTHHNEKQLS